MERQNSGGWRVNVRFAEDNPIPRLEQLVAGSEQAEVAVACVRIWYAKKSGKSEDEVIGIIKTEETISLLNEGRMILDIEETHKDPPQVNA